jgi:hypothetical protein
MPLQGMTLHAWHTPQDGQHAFAVGRCCISLPTPRAWIEKDVQKQTKLIKQVEHACT